MFTKEQGQELINNTTSIWTSRGEVNGRKYTSKNNTSKYIFLPAAGWWYYSSAAGPSNDYSGTIGYSWSVTWYSASRAWSIYFNSSNTDKSSLDRWHGISIRPVVSR